MKSIIVFIIIASFGGFHLAEVSAQTRTTKKKSAQQPKSTVASKTRARRVSQPGANGQAEADKSASNPKQTDAKPDDASDVSAANPSTKVNDAGQLSPPTSEVPNNPKPTEKSDPKETDNSAAGAATPEPSPSGDENRITSSDPILSLRDQIDAASSDQERIRLRLKLVDHFVTTERKSDALAELRLIANSNVFDPPGFYNVGNSFARLGETDGAIDAYRKAIDQRKGRYSRAYNNLGVVLLRAGRWDEAYDALLSALKIEGFRYPEASYNLGRVYAALGQNDLAVREWRRALAVDPQHAAAAQALARAGTEGRIVVESQPAKAPRPPSEEAAQSRQPVVKTAAPEKPLSIKASSASRSTKALAIDQTSFVFLQRARSASERGNMLEAVDNFQRVITRQGGYFPPANLEISYALLSLKRYDEAFANLVLVSNRDGAVYPISYFHLARLYELKGELKLAEAAFSQAAAAYVPTNGQFLLDLSRVREKQRDFKGALEAMEQYVTVVQGQGQKPAWSDERLAELRLKAAGSPK